MRSERTYTQTPVGAVGSAAPVLCHLGRGCRWCMVYRSCLGGIWVMLPWCLGHADGDVSVMFEVVVR